MNAVVFSVVLLAAALHATWNALVKHGGDKFVNVTAVVLGHAPFALLLMPWFPAPRVECWPYVVAGAALHVGYQIFLLLSYRIGDLTQVYPIARGIAPMMVAGISLAFLGVHLSSIELLAVLAIGTGIMSLVFVRSADGLRNPNAALLAVVTGCFIAGYSLVDGLGARAAGSAVGFYGTLTLINAAVFAVIMAFWKPGLVGTVARKGRRLMVLGGGASFAAYALVVWAFTQAPIALVTALRETSIVFALLIGVLVLKERLNLAKLVGTAVTVFGAVLLRFAR